MLGLALNPANAEQLLVCTRSPTLFTMTLQGQVCSNKPIALNNLEPATLMGVLEHMQQGAAESRSCLQPVSISSWPGRGITWQLAPLLGGCCM